MEFIEAKQTLASAKLNVSYDDIVAGNNSLFSLQDLEDAINYGIRKSWDYKIWPFSEISSDLNPSGSDNPIIVQNGEGLQYQSIFLAVVDGTPWTGEGAGKRNFRDFMSWIALYPSDPSKIWAEFQNELYFNKNAIANPGDFEVTLYGKCRCPVYSSTSEDDAPYGDNDFLPFTFESGDGPGGADNSGTDGSGNDAIILFGYAFLLNSEKKKNPAQAAAMEKLAYAMLDAAWVPYAEGRAQNSPQNQPFFNTDDYFARSNRPTRFDTNIGNFP